MDTKAAEKAKRTNIGVFCCYAREDRKLLLNLRKHIMPLQRKGFITLWADVDIGAGTEWKKEIHRHLNAAQIILLLVSSDFIYSEYCYSIEMQRALERHENGEARVIPIILRPCTWERTPLGELQALPTNAIPITKWLDQDDAFVDVIKSIERVVDELTQKSHALTEEISDDDPTNNNHANEPATSMESEEPEENSLSEENLPPPPSILSELSDKISSPSSETSALSSDSEGPEENSFSKENLPPIPSILSELSDEISSPSSETSVLSSDWKEPQTLWETPEMRPLKRLLSEADAIKMYLNALTAQVQGKTVEAISILQEVHTRLPRFRSDEIIALLQKAVQQLAQQLPPMGKWEEEMGVLNTLKEMPYSSDQAKKQVLWQLAELFAHAGKWEEEIGVLNKLKNISYYIVEPNEVQYVLSIAKQNQTYAGVYNDAQQLLQAGHVELAAQRLAFVWKEAPFYEDPAGLAKQVGMQAPDRETVAKEREHLYLISDSSPTGLATSPTAICWSVFCFLTGLGSIIGILTQSWFWAGGISILLALLLYIPRPYRAINPIATIVVLLTSTAVVFSIAWYMSTVNYNQSQVSHLWIIGDRTIWLSRQIYFGLASDVLLAGLLTLGIWLLIVLTDEGDMDGCVISILLILVAALLVPWFVPAIFGWGFGFGFGWPFAFVEEIIFGIGTCGLIYLITLGRRYIQYLNYSKKRTWYR